MKCLLVLFIVCAISEFVDVNGDNISNDDRRIEERLYQLGKDSSEFEEDSGHIVFRGESIENYYHADKKSPYLDDDRLESNVDERTSKEGELELGDTKESRQIKKTLLEETLKRFATEMAAGDTADLLGTNQHIKQSKVYKDLGRRFVPQYKYTGAFKNDQGDPSEENELVPEKAPPELVLVVAKESALLGPDKSTDTDHDIVDRKKISRTGDFWNGVWKENVNLKTHSLRDGQLKGQQHGEKKVLAFQSDSPSVPRVENELLPEKAPSELVLQVAKESAVLGPDKSHTENYSVDQKQMLRSGDYWNGVWKEEVDMKTVLRNNIQKKVLSSIKARIKPGSDFYKVVSQFKKVSPRLLYIINKKKI